MSCQSEDFAVACDKSRILVVDDEMPIRLVVSRIININLPDCQIDFAANGHEALESFKKMHHGIIISDLMMPVRNGEDAFADIKKFCDINRWEMPAVIFISGYSPGNVVSKIIESNHKHCLLRKPVYQSDLMEKIMERL